MIIIPLHLADAVAAESAKMTVFEDFVTEKVREGRGVIGLYPATDPGIEADYRALRGDRQF